MNDNAKERLLQSIQRGMNDYHWTLEDWVILNNHYHLMADSPEDVSTLPKMIQEIHKFTSQWIKKHITGLKDEKRIWYNYYDTCITYERYYFARLKYIWYNPVKHNYVDDPSKWSFGSYYSRTQENANSGMNIMANYPCDKLNIEDDY